MTARFQKITPSQKTLKKTKKNPKKTLEKHTKNRKKYSQNTKKNPVKCIVEIQIYIQKITNKFIASINPLMKQNKYYPTRTNIKFRLKETSEKKVK
jgi:hypothetical protein